MASDDTLECLPHQVIGTALSAERVHASLRAPGLFDSEVHLGAPDPRSRRRVLRALCHQVRPAVNVNVNAIECVPLSALGVRRSAAECGGSAAECHSINADCCGLRWIASRGG